MLPPSQGSKCVTHYYFDLRIDDNLVSDNEGLEVADVKQAQKEAMVSLGEIIRDITRAGSQRNSVTVEIRDQEGPVMDVNMILAVNWRRGPSQ